MFRIRETIEVREQDLDEIAKKRSLDPRYPRNPQ